MTSIYGFTIERTKYFFMCTDSVNLPNDLISEIYLLLIRYGDDGMREKFELITDNLMFLEMDSDESIDQEETEIKSFIYYLNKPRNTNIYHYNDLISYPNVTNRFSVNFDTQKIIFKEGTNSSISLTFDQLRELDLKELFYDEPEYIPEWTPPVEFRN